MKFTKRQQRKIDSCIDSKTRQLWINQFTHVNKIKKSDEYKEWKKAEGNY